ncbi:helix-turn-helix domain-containing protein [Streptomyces sp. XM4011]|uniref:helix-turn-helix domain-containing protein n=1 Tax=Streptomyces sp. XM4011 TaxID=2929780 RepID=UPI001FFBEE95|nr:helix-turn-helix transcriptional regulator [Streptomyces sp. XM4011]MCK1814743.1 helix-turn-helix domain-containing protein [Streptomyces sp. XM4011]
MNHRRWQLAREREGSEGAVEPAEVQAEREHIRLLMALGQAVHDRRVAIGLSEAGLAERLGVGVEEVEGIELGDPDTFHPTLLPRLAHALDARVDLRLVPGETSDVTFSGRAA